LFATQLSSQTLQAQAVVSQYSTALHVPAQSVQWHAKGTPSWPQFEQAGGVASPTAPIVARPEQARVLPT
jgi:hypothetical protein